MPVDAPAPIDYATVFDATPTPYVLLDADLAIVAANATYLATTGRTLAELVGSRLFDVFPASPDDDKHFGRVEVEAAMRRALADGRAEVMPLLRYDIPAPDGDGFLERYWSPTVVPVPGPDGRPGLLLHRAEDVTEYMLERPAGDSANEAPELLRRRMEQAQAAAFARSRELSELNRQLREAGEREREVALALQRAMLPGPPPALPGVRVATRYRPADDALDVGGDWFDVVRLDEARAAVAVGDVIGKGLRAAAVMGQLRSALSAATLGADGPPEALDVLDRYAATVPGSLGTTVVQARLDPRIGSVRYSRAGHPPPLLLDPSGAAGFLEDAGGAPLGAVTPGTPRPKAEVPFPVGATLVLYTDGLVERRGRPIDAGLAELAAAAERHAGDPVDTLADAVMEALLAGEHAADDAALVVARAVADG